MEGVNICPSSTLAGRKRQRGESDMNGKTRDQKRGDIKIFDRGAELSQMIIPEGDSQVAWHEEESDGIATDASRLWAASRR